MTSLYYFHPLSFLFVPSPMYILNSPTPTLFLVWTKYSLHPELLVIKMDVSRTKIHLDTSISMTSIFGRREYKIRLHEVALPLTIEEKKCDIGPSDREGLRGRKWCTCSDVASWGSRAKAVSNEDIPEGRRDVDRWAAGGRIRPQATTKGSEDLPRRRSARDNGAAGSGSPPSLSTTA